MAWHVKTMISGEGTSKKIAPRAWFIITSPVVHLVGDVLKGQEVGIVEDRLGPLCRGQIQGVTPHGDA